MSIKAELDKIQALVDLVNQGNAAFWKLADDHPELVRTKLGKDQSLQSLKGYSNIRNALGNDLEIAIGVKKVDHVG